MWPCKVPIASPEALIGNNSGPVALAGERPELVEVPKKRANARLVAGSRRSYLATNRLVAGAFVL